MNISVISLSNWLRRGLFLAAAFLLVPCGLRAENIVNAGQPLASWQVEAQWQQHKLMAELGVDRWEAEGYRGQGVKIALLDTGFRGYKEHLGKALPEHVLVRSFRTDGNLEAKDSKHGILCGEVLHVLAPDAELLFANWDVDRPDEFLAAARWAREQGARIISCSVVTPAWSDGEGGGAVHQALAHILGHGSNPDDLLCFASAGNTTERHWGGVFHAAGNGYHEWQPGQTDNSIEPWGDEQVSVQLYWQPGADYDLFVDDATTGKPVGVAHTDHHQGDRSTAVVYFQPVTDHMYRARVRLVHGQAGVFHLCTMESTLGTTTDRASVCFPADGSAVIAMGADDGKGRKVWYSACGPNSAGVKPDLMAKVPFYPMWREDSFAGTSASAPQGAALAALWWSRHPGWTANQVHAAMRTSAQDLENPGADLETGYGQIRLP